MKEPRKPGQPIAIDPTAKSADPKLPAFLARPEGAPVYHGFPVLDNVEVEGFKLGIITDFESEPCDEGDAFVVAPDNSRAGIVWSVGDTFSAIPVIGLEKHRWGVWAITFISPMRTRVQARENLRSALPFLKRQWEMWKQRF